DNTPLHFSSELLRTVDRYQPEVVYSTLASLRILTTVLFFARRYNVRIVPHFMDDWPMTMYTSSRFNRWANRKINSLICQCIARSSCGVGASPLMAVVYEKRYGIGFTWAGNPVEIPEVSPLPAN